MADERARVTSLPADKLRQLMARLTERQGTAAGIPLVPRDNPLPLSFAQERLWFLDRLGAGGAAYHIPAAVRLRGPLDAIALEETLAAVIRRHEALRTTFGEQDGRPVQTVHAEARPEMPRVDLAALPDVLRESELARISREEAGRPFDLARGPLLRTVLVRTGANEHVLVLAFHHIITDGWSLGVLLREVAALYPEAPAVLPDLPVQPADYAVWERERLRGETLEGEITFWRESLAGLPPLELPADRPRPASPSLRGGLATLQLPGETARALEALARRENATPFMVLLALFQALLLRYTGQSDFGVGTPVANRTRSEVEGLIGLFVNTLVLRADLSGEPGFAELVRRTREVTLAAFAHQELPFEKLVEELRPEREPGRNPLFQVLFTLQDQPWPKLRIGELDLELSEIDTGTARTDLTLIWRERDGSYEAVLEYSTDLFDDVTARRLLRWTTLLLGAAVEDPEVGVRELPLLDAAERAALLERGRGLRTPYPREATIHSLIGEQVRRNPTAVAVEMGDERSTYAELADRAHCLARRLLSLGVRPDDRVGLAVERSPDLVAGMLGILSAGGAYVPLDLSYPQERLDWMVDDAGVKALVHNGGWQGSSSVPLVRLGDATLSTEAPITARVTADHLAYVIYTSGSTGRPKGVAVPHRAVVRLLIETDYVRLEPSDRVAQVSNPAFDAATFEVWGALFAGARLVGVPREEALSPEALARRLAGDGITTLFLTTALFNQVARHAPGAFGSLRHLLFGGEAVDPGAVQQVLAQGRPERLLHVYGPTETTTFATWHEVKELPAQAATVPIGRPLANSTAWVVDPAFGLAPAGVAGELLLGGDGLARGYHERAELTAERFVPHPWSDRPGDRLYRTGDLVRRLEGSGEIEFLGRIDQQVKIRGLRIEPGEIEAVLGTHPDVAACAVVVLGSSGEDRRLAAWLAPREGAAPDPAALRSWLAARLPAYMVPAAFGVLDTLPLTPNGKVDRRALARLQPASAEARGAEPETPLERRIAAVWSDLLGHERIGRDDDFFALGGHSLLATRVVSRLREKTGVELPLREIFERPTVAALAGRLEELLRDAAGISGGPPPLRPLPREGALPLSFAQERLWFLHQLDPEDPAYNIATAVRLDGELDAAALRTALERIVSRHEALRTTFQPCGGGPVQVVAPSPGLALPQEDLSTRSDPAGEALRLAAAEALTPFDLERGPVLRTHLLRLGRAEHVLLLTVHHIAADGWSLGVFLRELAALYGEETGAGAADLPDLPVQYADYAVWQRGWLAGEALATRLAWWRGALAGLPDLDLPSDRPRALALGHHGAARALRLPEATWGAVETLALRESATPFMVLLAALQALLSRYSGQADFAVGTPVAGRDQVEIEELIGFFVNTLVLRADLAGDPSFRELLARTREATLGVYGHQDLPFEHLVEALAPERSLGRTPLFQVMLAYGNTPMPAFELSGLALTPLEPGAHASKFDLSFQVAPEPGAARIELTYRIALHDPSTAERLLGHLAALLEAATGGPGTKLSELQVLAPAERHQLLVEWNDSPSPLREDRFFHELFAEQAARTPDALAVTGAEERTFGELDRWANRIAHRLRRLGVRPEVRVGLRLEASAGALAGVLGILKAGGSWVPMDPAYPAERLALIQEDSGAPMVLALEDLEVDGEPDTPPVSGAFLDGAAYVVYTSGSTGRPKGTVVSHRSLTNFCWWVETRLLHGRSFPVVTSLSFDASIKQFLPPLLGGRAVWIPRARASQPAELVAELATRQRVIINIVPSLWRALLALVESGEVAFPGLEALMPSGEALDRDLVDRTRAAFPGVDIWNLYGPTETTSNVAHDHVEDGGITIGRPAAGARLAVVGRALEPLPVGVPGELLIGGPGVARGYLGRPGLTAERFIPDPFAVLPGARAYFSGDLVRRTPDGRIEYLGRLDHQVKIRGFRIEPGEIEAALATHPAVSRAVVVAREDSGPASELRLVAYVVPRPGEESLTAGLLRTFLAERLPAFLVPAAFVLLPALPLTLTGKVDRKALPAPAPAAPEAAGALTPAQELVAGVFADLLGAERPGAGAHFFELGGHSLLATRAVSRLRAAFGVELPLRALFEAPTVAGLAARLEEARRAGGAPALPPVRPVPRGRGLPLSFAQERLWFLDQLEAGSTAYNISSAVELRGTLRAGALAAALSEVARRHETLRTTFALAGGLPHLRTSPPVPVPLPLVDLTSLPEEARRREAARQASEEARRPFDLAAGPLFRATLLRLGAEEHTALLSQHHIVSDGWSEGVLVREVAALYGAFVADRPSPLPELPVQYTDFAVWQREHLREEALAAEIAWWRKRLDGAPGSLDLPSDRPRPAVQSLRGRHLPVALGGELARSLQTLARRSGATLFMTLLAGFQALLARYTGQDDVLVGSPIAGRTRPEVEGLIGFFVNTLVLRAEMEDDPSFATHLARVRETTLGAYENQHLPFERLVEELRPDRSLGRTPLFQVALVLQNAPETALELPGLTLTPREIESGTAKFDLTLVLRQEGPELRGVIEHSTDLFDSSTVERLAGHLATLLAGAAERPEARLSELPLLGEAERRTILEEWSSAGWETPAPAPIHELFAQQAARTPGKIAAICQGTALTYRELDEQAGRLARLILSLENRGLVGLMAAPDLPLLVGMLGILKAGSGFVPLDPGLPAERLARMVEDCGLAVLAADRPSLARCPAVAHVICLDELDSALEPLAPAEAGMGDGTAYVIFTSGSTGVPKGVPITHENLVPLLLWSREVFGFGEHTRVLQSLSYAFDFGVFEILTTLLFGGTIVLRGEAERSDIEGYLQEVREHGINTLHTTPSFFRAVAAAARLERRERLPLQVLHLGGEALVEALVGEAFAATGPECRLFNGYGPTEAAVNCALHEVGRAADWRPRGLASVPIGRPSAANRLYVLDRRLQSVPAGVADELLTGGVALSRGYSGQPDLTAARFIPDPFGEPGGRLYRTGDLVRWTAAGEIEFLGRIDQQVKVHGFRIELEEIEMVLAEHPGVRETAVLAREDGRGDRRLVAYVVPATPGVLDAAGLRSFLRGSLPAYMVPAAYVFLESLPLTPNGKLDRKALPAAEAAKRDYVAPRNALEEILAEIWMEVLGVERIGVHDDFFALGGHSLMAVRLTSRMRDVLGVQVPVRTLFDAPTLGEMAERLAGEMMRLAGDEVMEQVFAE